MNTKAEVGEVNKKKMVFRLVGGAIFLLVLLAIYLTTGGVLAQKGDGMCGPLPEGGSFVNIESGIYQVEGMNLKIFILRGIALGQPSSSSTDMVDRLPPCYSTEEGLPTLKNIHLIDKDGNRVTLIKGVGNESGLIEVEPDPLP